MDEKDRVVGSSSLRGCLREGLLHRAVAVVIVRPGGEVVLQQRSRRDTWHPGKWTLSSTGHVKKGESYADAASRELGEELGIGASLTLVKKQLLPEMKDRGLTEHEWVALFSGESDAAVTVDPVEVEGVAEYTPAELKSLLAGDRLTPDAVILLTEFLKSTS